MENLNKENFWNAAKEAFPLAVEAFCKWIDEYKAEVKWNELFNAGNPLGEGQVQAPKFHDLPYEMQAGIMNKFFIELFGGAKGIADYKSVEKQMYYHGEMQTALSELNFKLLHQN